MEGQPKRDFKNSVVDIHRENVNPAPCQDQTCHHLKQDVLVLSLNIKKINSPCTQHLICVYRKMLKIWETL